MQGYNTLWMPGADHAGIATQIKVEEMLAQDNISRYDLGRDKFIEKVWEWKEQYGDRIITQLKSLGASCDWERERFTMDEGCSKAVREVFVSLYEKGLIYQGYRITNWCPRCNTALSDIEVEHEDKPGNLYHLRYQVENSDEYIIVATTRPETMLGDSGVAVHPEDERYCHLIGKNLILPIVERKIPIFADDYVDPFFGTGAVKVTPAHDPNDFEMGQRHNLEQIVILNSNATMAENTGKYQGLDRYACRKALLQDLEAIGALVKIEEHNHAVGQCQRCSTIVEPMVSKQWFVKMESLAQPAIAAVETEKIKFVPERFTKIYLNWLDGIRDWCISRQIWWGHRIPAWYCECGETIVARDSVNSCPKCGSANVKQDEDVLDTWFSSALWPFSTMGWPEQTPELKQFYPTSVLVTGYDIIFFWVARMIMMGLEFQQEIPFKHVFIHGLVRDSQGRKMSKSLGNGIDPLEVVEKYGADTLRFMLITGNTPGNDMRFYWERVESTRNFANKLWNASRFVLMNLTDYDENFDPQASDYTLADKWILNRLNEVIRSVDENMDKFEFINVGTELYRFIWDDFCSWYIELSKLHLTGDDEVAKKSALNTLVYVLNTIVRLLHPIMPFVTEEIYQAIPHNEESIVISKWPEVNPEYDNDTINDQFAYLIDIIKGVREIRHTYVIKNSIEVDYTITTKQDDLEALLKEIAPYVSKLVNATCVGYNVPTSKNNATEVIKGGNTLNIDLVQYIDMEAEKAKVEKEIKKLEGEIKRGEGMLSNPNFTSKAPAAKVEAEKAKLEDYRSKYAAAKEKLAKMN